MSFKRKILNSQGKEIILNDHEKKIINVNQKLINALGYEVDTTTLTSIAAKVSEQKFFEIAPSDFIPVAVGEGAWSSNILHYRSFQVGDDFATGIINTGGNNGRMASVDAGVDSVSIKVLNWAKQYSYSLFDLQFATKSGNWDLVASKEKSRKKNWDLGIQKVAFLGLTGDTNAVGLLGLSGVTTDTTTLTQALSSMSGQALKDFCAVVLDKYRTNCKRSCWPSRFAIPESDYLGLAAPSSADFPLKSVLQVLEETFQIMTKNKEFKILPLAYGDIAYNPGATQQTYCLYNYDDESIKMSIPVDYNSTMANSLDNFNFQSVAYGQFTGVLLLRPDEFMYFKFTP